mgnify:CR=1 FL=1
MKKTLFLILFCVLEINSPLFAFSSTKDMLIELDNTINNKKIYEQNKETLVRNIKGLLKSSATNDQRYNIYSSLYEEYCKYNLDTALLYANKKFEVSIQLANKTLVNESKLDIANIYIVQGMYAETLEIMKGIDKENISRLRPRFYHTYRTVYGAMLSNCAAPEKKKNYAHLVNAYRDSLRLTLGTDDISYLFVLTDEMNEKGEYQNAFNLLLKKFQDKNTTVHEKAMLAYSLSAASLGIGNQEEAKRYLIMSAVNDLKTPVKEYKSLQELASMLYKEGDIDRAYNYINCSINDALQANARMNLPVITQLLPIISKAYDTRMKIKDRQQRLLLLSISILLLFLGIAMFFVYRQKKNLFIAKSKESASNIELSKLNEALKKTNAQLTDINQKLLESNSIKEAYVGRYMDLCSEYIDSVEKYRSALNKIARTEGTAELLKAIKASTYVEDELRDFYANFDATFLHLFPNFINQFNALLIDGEYLVPKQGRLLNTELRIFALIRLGITDSVKIANFLRHSVSTIYNYRVKMRNAALNDRDDFENQVMKIGLE